MNAKIILVGAVASAAILTPVVTAGAADASTSARVFANCTALNKAYPHGVGRSGARDHVSSGTPVTNFTRNTTVYKQNTKSDRDRDGIACEKH